MNFCGIRRYNVQTNRVNQILISGKEVDLFIYSDKFRFHRKKDPLQDENSHLHSRSATCSPLNTIRRFLLFYFFHIYNLPKKKKNDLPNSSSSKLPPNNPRRKFHRRTPFRKAFPSTDSARPDGHYHIPRVSYRIYG